jgi:hypothetical protein
MIYSSKASLDVSFLFIGKCIFSESGQWNTFAERYMLIIFYALRLTTGKLGASLVQTDDNVREYVCDICHLFDYASLTSCRLGVVWTKSYLMKSIIAPSYSLSWSILGWSCYRRSLAASLPPLAMLSKRQLPVYSKAGFRISALPFSVI